MSARKALAQRQAEMNRPEVRAAACMILHELRAFSNPEKISLLYLAVTETGKGIEYDLAALLIIKPDAPFGKEIEA